jgi:two-component system invasion response regulator UvrY
VLVEAVHSIARGKKYLSATVAQALALRDAAMDTASNDNLTAREFEVLRLLVQGQSIRDIARSMELNPKTIANHQSAIKQKLGANTAIQLLRKADILGVRGD